MLDLLLPEPGAFYVMDRGYIDFERLYRLHEAGSFLRHARQVAISKPSVAIRIRSIAAPG